MKLMIFMALFSCISCSHFADRDIASIPEEHDYFFAKADLTKSVVKLFPPEIDGEHFKYYFYVILKNTQGKFVDFDERELKVKSSKGQNISYKLERLFKGRYYVIIDRPIALNVNQLEFKIQGQALKEQFKLPLHRLDKKNCKIKFISKNEERHRDTFQIILADVDNKPLDVPGHPEIIIDPAAVAGNHQSDIYVEDMKKVSKGVWEFQVAYTEQNHTVYFSVRAQGTEMYHIYRFQHVEK